MGKPVAPSPPKKEKPAAAAAIPVVAPVYDDDDDECTSPKLGKRSARPLKDVGSGMMFGILIGGILMLAVAGGGVALYFALRSDTAVAVNATPTNPSESQNRPPFRPEPTLPMRPDSSKPLEKAENEKPVAPAKPPVDEQPKAENQARPMPPPEHEPDKKEVAGLARPPMPPPADPPAGQVAPPSGALPAQLLQQLKNSSVFIEVKFGQSLVTGSAFVVRVDGTTVYLATNRHVIDLSSLLDAKVQGNISAIFWSGRKNELVAKAEIVAADPGVDLAILKVRNVTDPPAPIDVDAKFTVTETTPVYIFGFPLGGDLAANPNGHPSVTVGRGSVSSFQRAAWDEIVAVQLDGEVNPGNSGGPVVDVQGRLVGVAVAKLRGTGISFAIPAVEVVKTLEGRPTVIRVTPRRDLDNMVEMEAEVILADPLQRLKNVALIYGTEPKKKLTPNAQFEWPMLPGSTRVELTIEGSKAFGVFKIAKAEVDNPNIALQTEYSYQGGRPIYSPLFGIGKTAKKDADVASTLPGERPRWRNDAILPKSAAELFAVKAHKEMLMSVAFSPDGKQILTGSGHTPNFTPLGEVKLWDATTGLEVANLPGNGPAQFTPDGKQVLFVEAGGFVKFRELASQKLVPGQYKASIGWPGRGGFVLSPNGKFLLAAEGGNLKLYDLSSHEVEASWSKFAALGYNALAFAPHGKTFAAAMDLNSEPVVHVCDATEGESLFTCKGHTKRINNVVFSPNGRRLATASSDGTIKLWNASSGKETGTLEAHRTGVVGLAFSNDGRLLASTGYDGTVRLWDVVKEKEITKLTLSNQSIVPNQGLVTDVVFSKNGQRLAAVTQDGMLRVWDVSKLLEIAKWKLEAVAEGTPSEPPPVPESKPAKLGGKLQPLDMPPVPEPGVAELGGKARKVSDLLVTTLNLPGKDILPCMTWSPDGRAFFAMDSNGILHRIATESFREELRLKLERRCSWLSMSAEGLLVTLPDMQEVWVIDSATLKIKARVAIPSVTRAVSAPTLTVGIATNGGGRGSSPSGDSLFIFDLKHAAPLREYKARDFNRLGGFDSLEVSPDGKWAFTEGSGQLFRFQINGNRLSPKDATPNIASGAKGGIYVSPDSQLVCVTSGGGNNSGAKNHPKIEPYSTYVYPTTNLTRPDFSIHQGAYPNAMAFDPKSKAVYASNHGCQLMVFNFSGLKQREYTLGGRDEDNVEQYLVHPDGGKLFIVGMTINFVELGK
jgi:WD40 repeat protein/S1-C subfamily serine protease